MALLNCTLEMLHIVNLMLSFTTNFLETSKEPDVSNCVGKWIYLQEEVRAFRQVVNPRMRTDPAVRPGDSCAH